jgi:prepilin-type N-terminal cleavage/methylation domain-containing protein
MKKKQTQTGFTLIEILIVVAIVGLLSSVLITSLNQTRTKSRDAQRKSNMSQMEKALELYYNTFSSYPSTGNVWWAATGGCGGTHGYSGPTGYIPDLAPNSIGVLPADPLPRTSACSGYNYRSDGTNYKLISNAVGGQGGPETFPALGEAFYDPARPTTGWMITNNTDATSKCPSGSTCW